MAARLRPYELHGVVVHAALAADAVHRDDVWVVQAGGGLGLDAEPLDLPGVHRGGHRQELQRHAAAQRDLLGLVDDPHAAAADLADQPEVAQLAEPGRRVGRRGPDPVRSSNRPLAQVVHQLQRRDQQPQPLGLRRVAGEEVLHVHRIARLEPVGELLDQVLEERFVAVIRARGTRPGMVRCGTHRRFSI
jgi:hypothetical protein